MIFAVVQEEREPQPWTLNPRRGGKGRRHAVRASRACGMQSCYTSIRSHTASNKPGTDTASGPVLAKESDEPLEINDLWTSSILVVPILVVVQERHARQGLVIDDVAQGRGPEDFCEEINHTLPESRPVKKQAFVLSISYHWQHGEVVAQKIERSQGSHTSPPALRRNRRNGWPSQPDHIPRMS